MATETNRYAEYFFEKSVDLPPASRFRKWKPTQPQEMKAFIGLQIEMGLDWRYSVKDHWSTRWISPGSFGQIMSRDRYLLLQSFLHFSDNAKQPEKGSPDYNPLFKVQPLLDLTQRTYTAVYQPGQNLAIDESMIKYKGRIGFRQYMPNKPTKYGIKDFVLAESATGYCLKVITYTGKETFARRDIPLTSQVVLDLLGGYEHAGHIVYMDNFYTSPDLFVELKRNGIGACGTARHNRKNMPGNIKPENLKMKKGDNPVFVRSGDVVACAWQDVKRVTCLSTVHTNNTCDKIIREKGTPTGRLIDKPVLIEEYNMKMGGVDRLDQMVGSYAFSHKSSKWYYPIYHRVREIALTNGYIIYSQDKHDSDRVLDAAAFRKAVVDELLADSKGTPARGGRPSTTPTPKRLEERHFPAAYSDKKYKPDCEVCSDRSKKRHQCNTYCKQCDIPMHAIDCFERYHTVISYKK